MSYRKAQQKKAGYMLIEIMVSLSIFAIVAVSSAGALLAIIDANSKAQNLKSVMDNLSVAVENMSRTMRIGTDFKCITGPNVSGDNTNNGCLADTAGTIGISFLPQDAASVSDRVQYYFSSGVIHRIRNGVTSDLTAPEVNITNLKFHLFGASTNDGQPRIFIIINGTAGVTADSKTPFNIQTSVTQRQPDNS